MDLSKLSNEDLIYLKKKEYSKMSNDGIRALSAGSKSKKSIPSKIWEGLAVPEKLSKEGLMMISQAVSPKVEATGNLPRDIAMNTPKIIAESLSEVAPGFVSRGSLLTAGGLRTLKAAKPLIKSAAKLGGSTAESISGLEYKTPGILKEAFKNPKLIFSKGKESASPVYEAAKSAGGKVRPELSAIAEKKAFVKNSLKLLKENKLNPTEALEARKELSDIKNSVPAEFFRKSTEKLNVLIKPVFGKADEIYSKGVKAQELRRLLPVNKSGGTSIAKTFWGTIGGALPLIPMSPAVQGTAASLAGAAAKVAKPIVNQPVASSQIPKVIELTVKQAKEWLREIKKNNPGIDNDKARELLRKKAKDENVVVPKKKK